MGQQVKALRFINACYPANTVSELTTELQLDLAIRQFLSFKANARIENNNNSQ